MRSVTDARQPRLPFRKETATDLADSRARNWARFKSKWVTVAGERKRVPPNTVETRLNDASKRAYKASDVGKGGRMQLRRGVADGCNSLNTRSSGSVKT